MIDPRTPVIAGAGQAIQRPGDWTDPADSRGPLELMVDAARAAAADAGAPALLARLDRVAVVRDGWPYPDPGHLVARRLGSPDASTVLSSVSGSSPQDLVARTAELIADGRCDVALVLGGEATWSRRRIAAVDGNPPAWAADDDGHRPELLGSFPDAMIDELRGFGSVAVAYALFEDSLRIARGETVAQQRDRAAALWARFSEVAAGNPFAWDRTPHPAAEIRDESPDNRMIVFPYPKALVANNTVDLASAVLLCSLDAARAAGVADDRLVFPLVGTSSHETWRVVNRDVLHETPGLRAAGHAAFGHTGLGVDDIEHLDLYACFPSIVQMSAMALGMALGIAPGRTLTVTGGLGFAGAPLANSSGQALATMVPLVREGGHGLIHANGGSATTHAFGIYGPRPPATPFRRLDAQDRAELRERASVDDAGSGSPAAAGSVEAATVVYDRSGPSRVVAMVRTTDDRRQVVHSTDADLIAHAVTDGLAGTVAPLP